MPTRESTARQIAKAKKKEAAKIAYCDLKVVAQRDFEIRTDAEFPVAIVYRTPGMAKEDDELDLAHKMAAAPEMYDAIWAVLNMEQPELPRSIVEKLSAAVNKAEVAK